METFKIGEIAIVVVSQHGRAGSECEILSDLKFEATDMNLEGGYKYKIRVHGASYDTYADPHQLRKKKPPKEELSTWEEIQELTDGWNPMKNKEKIV